MNTLRPLGNQVLIDPRPREEVSPGGVILPEIAQRDSQQGRVVAVGTGCREELTPGDVVLFKKWTGFTLRDLGCEKDEYVLLSPEDIIAVMEWR